MQFEGRDGVSFMLAMVLFFIALINVLTASAFELSGKYMAKRLQKMIMTGILVSLTILTVIIIPANNMDLYRYYRKIDIYRNGGLEYFFQTLREEVQWLFSIELLIISETPYNFLAPMISCIVSFVIFYLIYFNYLNKQTDIENSRISLIMALGFFFAWLPYFQIIDNLRSPMSMAVCAWGVYRQFFCDKSFKSQLVWYLTACLIHFQAVAILVFVTIYTLMPQIYRCRYLLIAVQFLFSSILWILQKIPVLYVQMLARKVFNYLMQSAARTAELFNEFTLSRIVMFSVLAVMNEILLKKVRNGNEKRYLQLIQLIVFFSLGCAGIPEVIRRYAYIISFFCPIELVLIRKYMDKITFWFFKALIWCEILAMQLWALLKMSRLTISGTDLEPLFDFLSIFFDF